MRPLTASDGKKPSRLSGLSTASLGTYLSTLGMVSLLLVGMGMILEAASVYVVLGLAVFQGYSIGPGGVLWAALATLLLLIAFTILFAALSVRKGLFPRTTLLVLFLAAVSFFFEGAGTLTSPTVGPSVTVSTLTIVAGVVLLVALFFSATESIWVMLTAAVLGLVSVMLLMVRNADVAGLGQVGGASLNSLLLSAPISQPTRIAEVGSTFAVVGIAGTTSLVYIAYLAAAIGLMFWAILRNSRIAPIAWVTAFVGFLLYGLDMAWGNAIALTNAQQGPIDWTRWAMPFVSSIVLLVAGFVVIAGSAVGLIFHGGNLITAMTQETTVQESRETAAAAKGEEVKVCPNCGTEISSDSVYCKKCGTKLASDWFSSGQVVTGKLCINCGTENPFDHVFCKKCGTRLAE